MNPELMQLLSQTFKLNQGNGKQEKQTKQTKKPDKEPFNPKRFPSYLKLKPKSDVLRGRLKTMFILSESFE